MSLKGSFTHPLQSRPRLLLPWITIALVTLDNPSYELAASRLLAELALIVGCVVGNEFLATCDCRTLAHVNTIPLTKPRKIAETLPTVTGAAKKMSPLMAIGSLFRAPTIEYVVEEVTRMHQAELYEMKMAAIPE